MRDCLVLVDVFDDFRHDDGDALRASFESRFHELRRLLDRARAAGVPLVYANDATGVLDGDVRKVVERAHAGAADAPVDEIAPRDGDRFVVKPRYSAFGSTPLALILRELETERIVLAGTSTEGCVAQTAIAAKEEGLKVTVVPAACATVDPELERIALAYLERVVGVRLAEAVDAAFD
jgi:nicotinamidase-related amidase